MAPNGTAAELVEQRVHPVDRSRKRALLAHFGSAKAVSRAGPDDLTAVQGISADMARKIYDFFHEKG